MDGRTTGAPAAGSLPRASLKTGPDGMTVPLRDGNELRVVATPGRVSVAGHELADDRALRGLITALSSARHQAGWNT